METSYRPELPSTEMMIDKYKFKTNINWNELKKDIQEKINNKTPCLIKLNGDILQQKQIENEIKQSKYELIKNEIYISSSNKHDFIAQYKTNKNEDKNGGQDKKEKEIKDNTTLYALKKAINKHLNVNGNATIIKSEQKLLKQKYNDNKINIFEFMTKSIKNSWKLMKQLATIKDGYIFTAQKFQQNLIPFLSTYAQNNGITKFLIDIQESDNCFDGITSDMTIIGGLLYWAILHLENGDLNSVNVMHEGMKLWILYRPEMINLIQQYIAKQAKEVYYHSFIILHIINHIIFFIFFLFK